MDWRVRRGCELYLGSFNRQWQRLRTPEAELEAQRRRQPEAGTVSVIVPVWNTKPEWLRALADSLRVQSLTDWECVLYDGGSDRSDTPAALKEIQATDSRFRVIRADTNLGIVGNTNAAAALARGPWLVFCDHDDTLEPDALWRLATAVKELGADLAYADEDRLTADGRVHYAPHFKPDLCPENLLACNYICHPVMLRRSLWEKLGGLRSGLEGSQDHDLMLRCVNAGAKVVHVPHILYHWRNNGGSMSHTQREKCQSSGLRAVEEAVRARCAEASAEVSGGRLRVLWPLPERARVRVLLTGSGADTEKLLPLLNDGMSDRVTCQPVTRDSLDEAARGAAEELLLLWDARLTPEPGTVRELAALAMRPEVGRAFPQVLDARDRILFSGCGCRNGRTFRRSAGERPERCDPLLLETSVHQVSLGSGLCVMLRRELWTGPDCAPRDGTLRNLVSPFAVARCFRWPGEPETAPFHDPCLIGR